MRVNLIRRRVMAAVIEGEAAQWIWEFAVSGVPDSESGMILSLPDLDDFLLKGSTRLEGYEILSAQSWMNDRAVEASRELLGGGRRVAWQRLLSGVTEHRCVSSDTDGA